MIEAGMKFPAGRQPRNAGSGRVRVPRRLRIPKMLYIFMRHLFIYRFYSVSGAARCESGVECRPVAGLNLRRRAS